MEFELHISEPLLFDDIVQGRKTVESRIYDEKRRKYKLEDYLVFCCGEERVKKKIVIFAWYPSLQKMLEREGVQNIFPCYSELTIEAAIREKYRGEYGFSEKLEKENGVLAIYFQ